LSRHLPRTLGKDDIIIIITKRSNIVRKDDDRLPRVVVDEVDEKENGDEGDADKLLEAQHNKGGCRRDDNVVDCSLFRRLSIFDDDRKENDDQSMTGREKRCLSVDFVNDDDDDVGSIERFVFLSQDACRGRQEMGIERENSPSWEDKIGGEKWMTLEVEALK